MIKNPRIQPNLFVNYPPFNALSGCFIPSSSSQNKGVINNPEFAIDLAQVIQVTAASQHTIDAVLNSYCSYPSNVTYFKYTEPNVMIWDYWRQSSSDLIWFYYCDSFQIQRATTPDFLDAVEVYQGMPSPYYNTSGTPSGSYYYRIRSHDDACGVSPWFYSTMVEITQTSSSIFLPLIIRD